MKIINISILSIISFTVIILFFSCSHSHAEGEEHNHDHGNETEQHTEGDGHGHGEEHEEGEIHLTKEQIETMNIQFGEFSNVKINDFIRATGTLDLPPNAYSSVSAKANGFIKSTKKYVEGSYIKKGVVMGRLENPEFIQQKQAYLEVQAELTFLHQELERQTNLVNANAGVAKKQKKLQS